MSPVESEINGTVATIGDPVGAVETLTSLIRAECADMDATRRVPSAVIGALQQAGVFRLLAPVEIGGGEVDPVSLLDVVQAASYADGSVGWCVMIGGCYAAASAKPTATTRWATERARIATTDLASGHNRCRCCRPGWSPSRPTGIE